MSRVAESLRADDARAAAARPAAERLRLALELGDSDARIFAAAHGLSFDAARAQLKRQRTAGRRPSRCTAEP
jgi:hypothetical protein